MSSGCAPTAKIFLNIRNISFNYKDESNTKIKELIKECLSLKKKVKSVNFYLSLISIDF